MKHPLRLRFHHNVIEHLGLRLYHNKPDKVLCELVSNSWDADAKHVWISIADDDQQAKSYISIVDDGVGMDRAVLQDSFLTVAAPRRSGANSSATTEGGRPLMGRKGIGKLAPFGICRKVSVITKDHAGKFNWIVLDLDAIQKASTVGGSAEHGGYAPEELAIEASQVAIQSIKNELDWHRDLALRSLSKTKSGTAIALTKLSSRLPMSTAYFKSAIASRFTVTLARPDFLVTVNDQEISEKESLPDFEYRIPETGWNTEEVGGNPVRYWVGFTGKPLPQSDNGIGVYAHGKLAQERPFSFNLSGNDLYLPYTYGGVEADWIDDFSEDIISTDRASIDWTHPKAALLHEWGAKNLRKWINRYQTERQANERAENESTVDQEIASGRLPSLTRVERKSLVDLLSEVSPRLSPDKDAKSTVASALADAWLHKPSREMLQELWSKVRNEDSGAENFIKTLDAIREYSVPEALSASVTLAQRAFALTVLYELVHLGQEPDLQRLIETFPWIVGPESEYLTANKPLSSFVREAEEKGLFVRHSDTNPIREAIKPDFVFLTDAKSENILVVELKSPSVELTLSNREQLSNYMTFLEGKYAGAKIQGLLIGNAPGSLNIPRSDMTLRSWPSVFMLARSAYTNIIASMLSGYVDDPADPRMKEVEVFGGPKVWELLKGISSHDEHLKSLISQHESARS